MPSLDDLMRRIEQEARRTRLAVDAAVYEQAGRDPSVPILFAGSLRAPLAFLARDLGRDEVLLGEPLIGGAGQRVRKALYRRITGQEPPKGDVRLAETTGRALLTNIVPYKPVGNKAYPPAVRQAFRPYVAELLTCHWTGSRVITMGTEAFLWFAPYAPEGAVETFWKRPDRYQAELACTLTAETGGLTVRREVIVAPLPHPSPLNRTYLEAFPGMLQARLEQAGM